MPFNEDLCGISFSSHGSDRLQNGLGVVPDIILIVVKVDIFNFPSPQRISALFFRVDFCELLFRYPLRYLRSGICCAGSFVGQPFAVQRLLQAVVRLATVFFDEHPIKTSPKAIRISTIVFSSSPPPFF
jgi:hypothetical protein